MCHEEAKVFLLFLLLSLGTKCKINLCKLSSENKTKQDDELSCVKPIAGETRFWSTVLMLGVFIIHETNCNELLGEQWPTYFLKDLSKCSTELRCSVAAFLV